jgi:MFS family permease
MPSRQLLRCPSSSLVSGLYIALLTTSMLIRYSGYDQGMMGGVNTSADYAQLMGFGHVDDTTGRVIVDDSLLQGGIVAVYYLGTLVGAFLGGWVGDKTGRIRTIALG